MVTHMHYGRNTPLCLKCTWNFIVVEQRCRLWAVLWGKVEVMCSPRRHLAGPGDVFGCHRNDRAGVGGSHWPPNGQGSRGAAKYPTCTGQAHNWRLSSPEYQQHQGWAKLIQGNMWFHLSLHYCESLVKLCIPPPSTPKFRFKVLKAKSCNIRWVSSAHWSENLLFPAGREAIFHKSIKI